MSADYTSRPVWERQHLLKGSWILRLPGKQWVIVDVDGTLADHNGVRDPYDESRVLEDVPYSIVVEWVRALFPEYNILIFSGRKDSCGDHTCVWLRFQEIPFDHILMRSHRDTRPDVVVKEELLDDFLSVFPIEDIAFVLDDRPKVVAMWRRRGVTVYPVRGELEEF